MVSLKSTVLFVCMAASYVKHEYAVQAQMIVK